MSEMIERVAKRLWDDSFDRMPDPPWEQTTELQKQFNRMLARSAIHAMREPTFDPEKVSYSQGMTRADWWRAMIDAALTGKP